MLSWTLDQVRHDKTIMKTLIADEWKMALIPTFRKTFLYSLLFNGLLFFGLLITDRLYIDDIGRSMLVIRSGPLLDVH